MAYTEDMANQRNTSRNTSRRTFLAVGGLAALALGAGGAWYRATHRHTPNGFALDGEARAALHAIAPAILDGALAHDPGRRQRQLGAAIDAVEAAIRGLPQATQEEVQDLFGLLALRPARRLLTGVPTGWDSADIAHVSAFLQEWRVHRLKLMRSAYGALHDLVLGAWYAQPASWEAIGYPGPPRVPA
jgi:hypothetical protein